MTMLLRTEKLSAKALNWMLEWALNAASHTVFTPPIGALMANGLIVQWASMAPALGNDEHR